MGTKLVATVNRFQRNMRVMSLRMESAEPHVMKFIGDGGQDVRGDDMRDMLLELMRLGHSFEVSTNYVEVSAMDFGPPDGAECEFCCDKATRVEEFDEPIYVCDQCSPLP